MGWPRIGRLRRRPFLACVIVLAFSILVLWVLLPYDNVAVLGIRFVTCRLLRSFRSPAYFQDWLSNEAKYPVDLGADVAFITKTGYGTKARVLGQLEALGVLVDGERYGNTLVIGDFNTQLHNNGRRVVVHDVVATLAEEEYLAGEPGYGRILTYKNLTNAIHEGRNEDAEGLAESYGWELDALKFIPGLDFAYRRMPDKDWYIMIDDDTYVLKPTLRMILSTLDPSKPAYLGNAVGDFRGRFAHGGSAFILSRAAMARLFDESPGQVTRSYVNSLSEIWGDKLVATTFMKVGVYLDERYSHLFNGESPRTTRVRPDRFCSPIVSFHGLAQQKQMAEVGHLFRYIDGVVSWGQLWKIYGQPDLDEYRTKTIWPDRDHVGTTDGDTMTTEGVESAEICWALCNRHQSTCLAWTWDANVTACHISPWVIVGEKSEGKYSGLNVARLEALAKECSK